MLPEKNAAKKKPTGIFVFGMFQGSLNYPNWGGIKLDPNGW